jgi:hypothetical protein
MQHLRKRLCVITVGIGGRRVGSTQAHLFPNPGIDRRDPETDGKTKRRSTVLLITAMACLYLLAAFDGAPAQGVRTAPLRQPGAHWPRIAFPDGSGSIALPPGWRINNAQRASAELQGPNGEAVAVGSTMPVGPPVRRTWRAGRALPAASGSRSAPPA